jgi:hypothetical protein
MSLSSISNIPNAVESAQLGISLGLEALDGGDAQAIAASVSGSGGATDALVNSLQQKAGVEASAQVLASADQMLGTLVDVTA